MSDVGLDQAEMPKSFDRTFDTNSSRAVSSFFRFWLNRELSNALSNFPRAKNIGLDMQKVVDDPDFFGGKEDREPWADQAYSISNWFI